MEFYRSQLQLNLIILKQQGFLHELPTTASKGAGRRGEVYKSDANSG